MSCILPIYLKQCHYNLLLKEIYFILFLPKNYLVLILWALKWSWYGICSLLWLVFVRCIPSFMLDVFLGIHAFLVLDKSHLGANHNLSIHSSSGGCLAIPRSCYYWVLNLLNNSCWQVSPGQHQAQGGALLAQVTTVRLPTCQNSSRYLQEETPSLSIQEMQLKTTIRYHHTPIRAS